MHDKPIPFSWKNVWTPLNIWTVVLCVLLDQGSKYLIIFTMDEGRRIPIFSFFNLVHYKNKGAAFGMFHDASPTFRLIFFGLITIICVAFLIWSIGTSPRWDRFHRFSLALILGGALGNVKDRVIFQEVTDFIEVFYKTYYWPAFNVADMAISVGVTLLIARSIPWASLFGGSRKRQPRKRQS